MLKKFIYVSAWSAMSPIKVCTNDALKNILVSDHSYLYFISLLQFLARFECDAKCLNK